MMMLAWTPFLSPAPLDGIWFLLLIPLACFTAIAYKAVRAPRREVFWKQTVWFAVQIIVGIAGLYAAALIFLEAVLPRIA